MATRTSSAYHHGDLRNALVGAGVSLAREGGPTAIVLREAARRVGVSQTAAYRHFASLPELVAAVATVSLTSMADVMRVELRAVAAGADAKLVAVNRLRAVGRGYIYFALDEPGLFATAFSTGKGHLPAPEAIELVEADELMPDQLLHQSLDGLISAGLLDPARRPAAALSAWAGVHGLSLLLGGPMTALTIEDRNDFIDDCLELVAFGLIKRGE
jgi:AcrR family transcriptional regulator